MIKLKSNKNLSGKYFIHKQVLRFPQIDDFISEDDIMNLFKGLIELVRKNAETRVEQKYQLVIKLLQNELRDIKQNK